LSESVPGTPGSDYPIYNQPPQTSFQCGDGQKIEGGYYADPQAECQAFHICTADGYGSLTTSSFLCPNGTLFNQQYFICDWWFNVDCSQAEQLYSRNNDVAADRERFSNGGFSSSSSGFRGGSFSSPVSSGYGSPISSYNRAARQVEKKSSNSNKSNYDRNTRQVEKKASIGKEPSFDRSARQVENKPSNDVDIMKAKKHTGEELSPYKHASVQVEKNSARNLKASHNHPNNRAAKQNERKSLTDDKSLYNRVRQLERTPTKKEE